MTRDLDAVLASIDGALADDEFPDAMRWSPEPATVDAPAPFDGEVVWQPEQRYEDATPYRWGRGPVPDPVIVDDPIGTVTRVVEDEHGLRVEGTLNADGAQLASRLRLDLPLSDGVLDPLYLVDPAHRAEVARERQQVQARVLDRLAIEHRPDCSIVHEYVDRPPACQCGALDRAALTMPRVHRSPFCGFASAVAAAQQHEAALAAVRRLFADMGEGLRPLVEAFGRRAEETGKGLAEVVEEFRRQHDAVQAAEPLLDGLRAPVGTSLRDTDPAAYALQLRQSRGTGPDRQVQHRHRPRRHS